MRLQKMITFRKTDKEILDHLNEIDNASAYIVKLIKADLSKPADGKQIDLTEVMEELHEIKSILVEGNYSVNVSKKLDKEGYNALKDLIGDDWE